MFGDEATDDSESLDLALVLGLILVAVVILFGLFVLVLFLRRRFMRKQDNIETGLETAGAKEINSTYVSLPVVAFPLSEPAAKQANGQNHLPLPVLYDTKLPKAPLYSNPVAVVKHEYDLPDTPFVH